MRKGLRQTIESTCQVLLPGRPVYVLLSREVPRHFRPNGASGLTGRGLDLVLRASIGGRWRCRGAVILLNDIEIRGYSREIHRAGPMRIHARRETWKVVAHEIAHLALREILPSELDENPNPILTSAFADNLTEFCTTTPLAVEQPVPWIGHDGVFIRTLFHVAHRVRELAGEWLPCNTWFSPFRYGLYGAEYKYASALGDEPERLVDVPLTEIANIPPPKKFTELWRGDVRTWFASIENPTDSQTAALICGLRMFTEKNVDRNAPIAGTP